MRHCSILEFLHFQALETKNHTLSLNFMWVFCHLFFFLFANILLMLSDFFKHIFDFNPLDFPLAFPRHSMSVPCLFFQILVLVTSSIER